MVIRGLHIGAHRSASSSRALGWAPLRHHVRTHVRCEAQNCNSPSKQQPMAQQEEHQPWTHAHSGPASVRLAVLGDLHGDWDLALDGAALQWLQPDMAVVVGDLANESLPLAQQVAQLQHPPMAVLLGNHDAWHTGREVRRRTSTDKASPPMPLADMLRRAAGSGESAESLARQHPQLQAVLQRLPNGASNTVVRQLEAFGESHVGYAGRQISGKRMSIVGARPFSHGGGKFSTVGLVSTLWPGVDSLQASAERIQQAVAAQVQQQGAQAVVIVGHNAPLGLGGAPYDISGVDWMAAGGDHGDPDLRLALDALHKQYGRIRGGAPLVPLVLCGHMHDRLKDGSRRRMVHVDANTGCVTVNAAVVPRVRAEPNTDGKVTNRHFVLVELEEGRVVSAQNVFVQVTPKGSEQQGYTCKVCHRSCLLKSREGQAGVNYNVWDAQHQCWNDVFVPAACATVASL